MVALTAMKPVSPGFAAHLENNFRPVLVDRPVVAGDSARASDGQDARHGAFGGRETAVEPLAEPSRSRTADFAAAVISGALAPTPQSMEELIRRIGASEIPEESQARLKDLLA
jgi:hypothetical protein